MHEGADLQDRGMKDDDSLTQTGWNLASSYQDAYD
jgi:hypothetical protein